jgi:hypothetical protein
VPGCLIALPVFPDASIPVCASARWVASAGLPSTADVALFDAYNREIEIRELRLGGKPRRAFLRLDSGRAVGSAAHCVAGLREMPEIDGCREP